jgi:hypothetical protein
MALRITGVLDFVHHPEVEKPEHLSGTRSVSIFK